MGDGQVEQIFCVLSRALRSTLSFLCCHCSGWWSFLEMIAVRRVKIMLFPYSTTRMCSIKLVRVSWHSVSKGKIEKKVWKKCSNMVQHCSTACTNGSESSRGWGSNIEWGVTVGCRISFLERRLNLNNICLKDCADHDSLSSIFSLSEMDKSWSRWCGSRGSARVWAMASSYRRKLKWQQWNDVKKPRAKGFSNAQQKSSKMALITSLFKSCSTASTLADIM